MRKPGNSGHRDDEQRREREAQTDEGQEAANRNARGFWDQQKRREDEARGLNRDD